MSITSAGFIPAITDPSSLRADLLRPGQSSGGFVERMGEALQNLAESQTKSSNAARAYELGERQDLAGVMVEQQVASLGFQLALNVRNRALTAYRDVMNMSV